MDDSHSTTDNDRKGRHLTYDDRMLIQTRLKDGKDIRAIARKIGCSPSTVSNEIKRGTVLLYHGKKKRYRASVGQKAYEDHSPAMCEHLKKEALPVNRWLIQKRYTVMLILAF